MTTTLSKSPSDLAVFGGTPAVTEPLAEGWQRVHQSDIDRIVKYASRQKITGKGGSGPIGEFEKRFCELAQTKYALAMNSGTAALHSAYFAVGVRPGDEVIVPTYTFFATAAPLLQLGATPIFCDIDDRTLAADPEDVERRITPRTKAICVVHVWGNPARLDRFSEIARRHKLGLVEDCSHAHGATYQGKPVGNWGDIGCFSLQGVKPVTGGEGGIAVTNDAALYDRMLALGHYGRLAKEQKADSFLIDDFSLGLKFRPHLFAILLAMGNLGRLSKLNELRRRNYGIVVRELQDCPALTPIDKYPDAEQGGLLSFMLRYHSEYAGGWTRGAFVKAAQAEGVPIDVDRYTMLGHNARLLHETRLFRELDYSQFGGALSACGRSPIRQGEFPVAERLADELVALPPFTKVNERYVRACCRALRKVADMARECPDLRT